LSQIYALANGDRLVETGYARSANLHLDKATGRFTLSDGTWIEPRTFVVVDPRGVVIASYGHPSREFALDDYLYILDVYFVRNSGLFRGTLEIGGPPGNYTARLSQERVEVDGIVAF
jgi:hypothetical protein